MKKKVTQSLGAEILESLNEGLAHAQGKIELRSTTVTLPEEPPKLGKKAVKDIRKSLNCSQAVLARFLGVSPSVVRAWEQGQSKPNGSASRLLQIAAASPRAFLSMVSVLGKDEETLYYKGIEAILAEEWNSDLDERAFRHL